VSGFKLLGDVLPHYSLNEVLSVYDLQRTIVFLIIFSIAVLVHSRFSSKHHSLFLTVLLIVQFAELFIYKASYTALGSVAVSAEKFNFFQMSKIPYTDARLKSDNERSSILTNELKDTVLYESANLFTFLDPPIPIRRNDYCMRPFNNYLNTFRGTTASDSPWPALFPDNKTALQFSGILDPKLQFYTNALFLPDEYEISTILIHNNFNGEMPLLFDPSSSEAVNLQNIPGSKISNVNYKVVDYSANHILVEFNNSLNKKLWLTYSDIWNPYWKATVNGVEKPIYKANLAYKAVETQPGLNRVHFYFHSTLLGIAYILIMLHSALAFIVIIFYIFYIYKGAEEQGRDF
jgi:hypothetical protein